ncbi:hypothetical protein [Azotobacter salinestris]|uniref:hypothetical protein n=1 Tax=Azotobacter salinestris TaxID=69964 RepID=UPI0032E05384
MSSLLFYTSSEEAIVATDTLVAEQNGNTLGHSSKAIALPHLRLIIAATGAAALFNRWIGLVNEQSVAFDVDTLDTHAPLNLQMLWGEMQGQFPSPHHYTATLYHFGFSHNSGLIHAFAYRSESNFASERLRYGLGIKPDLENRGGIDFAAFPAVAPEIMRAQIKQEDLKASPKGVRIGGQVQITHLAPDGFSIYSMGSISSE